MVEDNAQEEQLQLLQDGRVYPVGRVLRATFNTDNHHTLGHDVTGLMIDLSKVPYEPGAARSQPFDAARPPHRSGLLARLGGLFAHR